MPRRSLKLQRLKGHCTVLLICCNILTHASAKLTVGKLSRKGVRKITIRIPLDCHSCERFTCHLVTSTSLRVDFDRGDSAEISRMNKIPVDPSAEPFPGVRRGEVDGGACAFDDHSRGERESSNAAAASRMRRVKIIKGEKEGGKL